MRTPSVVMALLAGALWLGACNETVPPAPIPMAAAPVPAEPGSSAGYAGDPSVPSTESVFPAARAPQSKPPVPVSDGERSPAQTSKGVPMPGQNNDHSAPLDTAKSASAP